MKQVTAVLIGAGLRGGYVYSAYALEHPNEFKVVAVAEPDDVRRTEFAQKHQISEHLQFTSYEDILKEEKMADCAMVCTQDNMHFEPVIMAMEKGYHVLCEKPMSTDAKEIMKMGEAAEKYQRELSICHVLRYSPFFSKLKKLIDGGRIGTLMSIQHIEQVGYWHHAHSFVRGNWANAEQSSPMILQKCCHDMDILLWLIGSPCKKISSFGKLTYFNEAHAPKDAPERCLDGCPHRNQCAFYAPKFYLEHPKAIEDGLIYAVTPDISPDAVTQALKTGPYGRCVFHCGNTVVDHQVVNLEFENEVNVSFTMCAFTDQCVREIRIMGTEGEITGNMEEGEITIKDFVDGSTERILLNTPKTGHSGSDTSMMKEFVALIASGGEVKNRTNAQVSVESHLIALAAEESRVTGKTVDFEDYRRRLEEK